MGLGWRGRKHGMELEEDVGMGWSWGWRGCGHGEGIKNHGDVALRGHGFVGSTGLDGWTGWS